MDRFAANVPKDRFDAMIARSMEDALVSEEVYAEILADPDFFRQFI